MAILLPKLIVVRSVHSGGYLKYITKPESENGFVSNSEANIFNTFAKIEVERANIDNRSVHLRFCHSNKYWAAESPEPGSRLRATSTKPIEDLSKSSCTLFEPFRCSHGNFSFRHAQSGGILTADPSGILTVDSLADTCDRASFRVIDWDTLVTVPKHIVFKCDVNNMYLRAESDEGREYLRFSSKDCSERAAGFEAAMDGDGYVRVSSDLFGKFWRRGGEDDLIWADSSDTSYSDKNTLFWPEKVGGNIIALRNAGNNLYCTGKTRSSCLSASVATTPTYFGRTSCIGREARLQVKELVSERQIFDVRFRIEDSRIYDDVVLVIGKGYAENNSPDQASLARIEIGYQDCNSYSFSNNDALKTGVESTITAVVPFINDEGRIQIPSEDRIMSNKSFEWNMTTQQSKEEKVTFETDLPPRSRVAVDYLATVGRCDVPFSYSQRDKLSQDDWRLVTTQHDDGIFTALNYYTFHFGQPQIQPL